MFERARTSDTETRWWANDAALRKVFGSFAYPDNSLYVDVILTLTAIQDQLTMKTSARISAHGFIEALLKYETVFTAQIFLRIFEQTSPLSKYLQTEGIDILYAYRMVRTTHECLSSMSRDFVSIKAAADRFAQWTNEKLQEQDKETELEVEATLPPKRRKKKLIRPGEMAHVKTVTVQIRLLRSLCIILSWTQQLRQCTEDF